MIFPQIYLKDGQALTLNPGSPHPKSLSQNGRGTLKNVAPLRPWWEKGLGDEGLGISSHEI